MSNVCREPLRGSWLLNANTEHCSKKSGLHNHLESSSVQGQRGVDDERKRAKRGGGLQSKEMFYMHLQ